LKPTSNQIIKLRTQHYQGEPHPAARKAVISLSIASLFPPSSTTTTSSSSSSGPSESEVQAHKFKLLAGPRWDSIKNEIKISCELFPNVKMNEKWCSDTLDKLIAQAKVRVLALIYFIFP
jgi:small subunit ribosomal protein S35